MPTARCLCGTLRYEIDGPFAAMIHCHCSMCRKHHGTGFSTFAVAPIAGFRYTQGEDKLVRYRSSAQGVRSFCAACGSSGPWPMPERGIVAVPAAAFDADPGIRPQRHFFVASKAPWDEIADDLPRHDAYPDAMQRAGMERPGVAPRAGITDGSCLCGGVRFEATGAPLRMMNCHCSRCRLGRAAAHATNLFYKTSQFRWTSGEALVKEFKVPEARFHTAAFCSICGGKLPRVSPERELVVVPAGSLDTDPGARPQAHIFTADKAPWFEIAGTLPRFAAMPPA